MGGEFVCVYIKQQVKGEKSYEFKTEKGGTREGLKEGREWGK